MAPLLHRGRRERARLFVSNWHVGCPRRGDVELDECLACGYLDVIDGADRPRFIECGWRRPDLAGLAETFAALDRRT